MRGMGLLAALAMTGCHGRYRRPVSDEPIPADPDRLSRGSYLVNQVLGFMPKLMFQVVGAQLHEPARNVAAPDRANSVECGRYLVRAAGCGICHSLRAKGPRRENDSLYLAGSDAAFEHPALGKVWARNLTGDVETGLGRYDAAAIHQAMRDGGRLDGKKMAPPMSGLVPHYSGLSETDLDAMVAYLKTAPAAKHRVPERQLIEPLRSVLGG